MSLIKNLRNEAQLRALASMSKFASAIHEKIEKEASKPKIEIPDFEPLINHLRNAQKSVELLARNIKENGGNVTKKAVTDKTLTSRVAELVTSATLDLQSASEQLLQSKLNDLAADSPDVLSDDENDILNKAAEILAKKQAAAAQVVSVQPQ